MQHCVKQLNKGNKSFYTSVEYGRIRGYTVNTRIREYTVTHSVSMWIKSRIFLYSVYLGKYCAVFKTLGMKYLIQSDEYRKRIQFEYNQLNSISRLVMNSIKAQIVPCTHKKSNSSLSSPIESVAFVYTTLLHLFYGMVKKI